MPIPNTLMKTAFENGETVAEMIERLLAEEKTPFKVGVRLGVYENSIRYWLKRNGYRHVNGEWVHEGEKESA